MKLLTSLEDLNKIIEDSNLELNAQTGGFYDDTHSWVLRFDRTFSEVSKLEDTTNSDELMIISANLFLKILNKTEQSFYKIFSES